MQVSVSSCPEQRICKKNTLPKNRSIACRLSSSSRFLSRLLIRSYCDKKAMVDPQRVASYDDILKCIKAPPKQCKKILIDVREPDEIGMTGKIPSSINIPLNSVPEVLSQMSNEDFRKQYKIDKPTTKDELIFYCRSGRRSTEALNASLKLGYSNSKTYLGSWEEWSSKQRES